LVVIFWFKNSFPNGKSNKALQLNGFIAALIVPDGSGAYYGKVVNVVVSQNTPNPAGADTGPYGVALVQ
jgi:hypothetical protein